MDLLTCEYCGMEFSTEYTHCPLCGRSAQPTLAGVALEEPIYSKKSGGARLKKGGRFAEKQKPAKAPKAPKAEKTAPAAKADKPKKENPYALPYPIMVAICIILALAVLAGAFFALDTLGHLDFLKPKPKTEAPAPTAPKDATVDNYTNEEDLQIMNPSGEASGKVIPCTGLTLGISSITFEEPEQFYNITVLLSPEGCTEEVVFSSADETVAQVSQQGKIMAIGGGTTEITATCGDYWQTCLVTCDFLTDESQTQEQLPPALSSTEMRFTYPGQQATLLVTNIPADTEIEFTTDDDSIATISPDGLITAAGSGSTTVTATIGETVLTCAVHCDLGASAEGSQDVPVEDVTISHADVTMSILGEYFRLSLKDGDGDRISGVVWTSSDEEVCTVDADGIVYATGRGTTTVYTTYGGESFECIIRCPID